MTRMLGSRRMRNRYMLIIMALLAGSAGGAVGAVTMQRYGAMPHHWAAWSQVASRHLPARGMRSAAWSARSARGPRPTSTANVGALSPS
jgi:hypothetical protein